MLVVLAGLVLLWAALYNGYPLTFWDTRVYVEHAGSLLPRTDRLIGYSLVIRLLSAQRTLWPVAVAQCLLVAWLVWLCWSWLGSTATQPRPRACVHAAWYLGLIALLGTGTALPWIAGQLMADVFTPVLVVCLWLVGEGALASRAQRLALYALISLCVMVHLTHLPLGLGLLGVGYVLARGRGAPNPARAQLAALLALLAGLGGIAGFNASRTGKWTLASGSDAFLLAHLVESGIAGAQLEARCPERGYMLCAVRTQLPMSTDEFLWADKLGLDPWNNLVAVRAETRHLLHDSLRERPLMHLSVALHYTLRALGRFGTGEGLDNDAQPLVSAQIARFTPGDVAAYHAARQQQNAIPVASLRALHTPLGWLLQAVGLVLLLRALKRGREAWQLPALRYVAFAAAAILLNALLCANLSGVYDRYQSRLVWLLAVGLWAPLAQGITRLGSASARRAIDAR